jgi:hypothetical protein
LRLLICREGVGQADTPAINVSAVLADPEPKKVLEAGVPQGGEGLSVLEAKAREQSEIGPEDEAAPESADQQCKHTLQPVGY